MCDRPVRRVAITAGAMPYDGFTSFYAAGGGDISPVPKLTITDVTDIADGSAVVTRPRAPKYHRRIVSAAAC